MRPGVLSLLFAGVWMHAADSANLIQMPSQQNCNGALNIERTQISDHVVLIVSGRMDAENAPQFEEQCKDCIEEGHTNLVADLGGLVYVSSMGLRSFLAIAKNLQNNGGTLRLCCLKGLVKQVFEITGLLQVLSIYESVDSASARLNFEHAWASDQPLCRDMSR